MINIFQILALSLTVTLVAVDWQFEYTKEQINIYTREVPNSSYIEARSVAIVNTSPGKLLNLLNKLEKYPQIVPNCNSATKIRANSKLEFIAYLTFEAPWPLSDRDVALKVNVDRDPDDNIMITMLDYRHYDKNDDYQRIKELRGQWLLKPKGDQTEVTFQLFMDPGGNIPAWMVNNRADDEVFGTLKNLKAMYE